MRVGINEISKWTTTAAERIGLNTKKVKITNHSHRSSAVSHLAKKGVSEQELIKLTGHGSATSIKPYLQMDSEHHLNLVSQMRVQPSASNTSDLGTTTNTTTSAYTTTEAPASVTTTETATSIDVQQDISCAESSSARSIIYQNCTFICTNLNCSNFSSK